MHQTALGDYQSGDEDPWRDKETLYRLYHEEGLHQTDMAELFGCHVATVSKWMQKFDIPVERTSVYDKLNDPDWLREEYIEKGRNTTDIADEIGCTHTIVCKWIRRHGMEIRPREERSRKNHANFRTNNHGREQALSCYMGEEGEEMDQVLIHRLVAVAEHGFEAVSGNVVHHKNNIPWDNRPPNLEPMSAEEHRRLHASEDYDFEVV